MPSSLYDYFSATAGELGIRTIRNNFKDLPDDISEETKKAVVLIKNICSLHPSKAEGRDVYQPGFLWDGKRSFAMEDLSDDDLNSLKALELDKLPLAIKARIEDVLWCAQVENHHIYGQKAVDDYLELFDRLFDADHWFNCFTVLERGTNIAAVFGKRKGRHQKCLETAYNKLIELDGKDKLYCSIKLAELLVDHGWTDLEPVLEAVDKTIDAATDANKLEAAYLLKIKLLKASNEPFNKCRLELADFYVSTVDEIGSLDNVHAAESFLKKALKIYTELKAEDKKREALEKMHEVQRKKISETNFVDFKYDISEATQYIKKKFENLTTEQSFVALASMINFYTQDDLQSAVMENEKKYVFSSLFCEEIVNRHGQPIAIVPPLDSQNKENLELHMLREANRREEIVGKLFCYAVALVREKHGIEENCLDYLFANNWIIPEGREAIIKNGLLLAFRGEMFEALHILAPQTENMFREIAKQVGGITEKIKSDGRFEEKAMSSVLDLQELKDCYDEDRLFLFKGLLNEPAGANIRNRIAHGLMSEDEAKSRVSYFFIGALLRLIVMASPNALKTLVEMRKNENLNRGYGYKQGHT